LGAPNQHAVQHAYRDQDSRWPRGEMLEESQAQSKHNESTLKSAQWTLAVAVLALLVSVAAVAVPLMVKDAPAQQQPVTPPPVAPTTTTPPPPVAPVTTTVEVPRPTGPSANGPQH
jgi:hypothetical protein